MIGPTHNKLQASTQPGQAGDGLPQSIALPFEHKQTDEKSASLTVAGLSPRECEVLALLARGFSYNEIAGSLHVSANTVSTYVRRIYMKLQVHSRGKAVAAYVQFICGDKLWPR